MKTNVYNACIAVCVWCCACLSATFDDNFDRPDSEDIGNGWTRTAGDVRGELAIRSGVVTALATDGDAGMYRPWQFDGTVTVTATITDISGFGGVHSRFYSLFTVRNNGSYGDGYGISIYRGDQNYEDSEVSVIEGGQGIGEPVHSTFQFKERLVVVVRFAPDGSIDGSITEGTNSFAFAFGPRAITSTGGNVAWCTGFPDSRTSNPTYPTLDDFSISSPDAVRPTITYSYDSLNRLTSAVHSSGVRESYLHDPAGNRLSRTVAGPPDTTAPSVPMNLTAPAVTPDAVTLAWDPSADTGGSGLSGYWVYLDGKKVADTTLTSTTIAGLSPARAYCATVAAYDQAGNTSMLSTPFCFTTETAPDRQGPTLSVTSVVPGQMVVTNLVSLNGVVTDGGVGSSGVETVLVNNTPTEGGVAVGGDTATWSALVPLQYGTNNFRIIAIDGSTNHNRSTNDLALIRTVSRGEPPAVVGSPILESGSFGVNLAGYTGAICDVWSSTNLIDWTWLTNISFGSWFERWVDVNPAADPYRFYAFALSTNVDVAPKVLFRVTMDLVPLTPLALGDDARFYGTEGSGIFCIDSTTLDVVWRSVSADGCSRFPASAVSVSASGIVFAVGDWNQCSDGRLVAVSTVDGSILWEARNDNPHPRHVPAINDSVTTVFYGSDPCSAIEYAHEQNRWTQSGGLYIGERGIALDNAGNLYVGSHGGVSDQRTVVFRITDDQGSGRTSLLKRMATSLMDTRNCIWLDGRSITETVLRDPIPLLAAGYRKLHADGDGWERFLNDPPSSNLIFIDDFHLSPINCASKRKFLGLIHSLSDSVVAIVSQPTLLEFLSSGPIDHFPLRHGELMDLSREACSELADRWCRFRAETVDDAHLDSHVAAAQDLLEVLFGRKLMPRHPIFVLTALQMIDAGSPLDTLAGSFGGVYETVIHCALSHNARNQATITSERSYLEELAYWSEFEPSAGGREDFNGWFAERKAVHLAKVKELENSLLAKGFLSWVHSGFRFHYQKYYFLASFLRDNPNRQGVPEYVKRMVACCWNEDYANTVLFLAYLQPASPLIATLTSEVHTLFAERNSFDIRAWVVDAPFPAGFFEGLSLSTTQPEENRRLLAERLDQTLPFEKPACEAATFEKEEEAVDDQLLKLIKGFHLIKLIGQLLRNSPVALDAQQKDALVRSGFGLALRVADFVAAHCGPATMQRLAVSQVRENVLRHASRADIELELSGIACRLAYLVVFSVFKYACFYFAHSDLDVVFKRILDPSTLPDPKDSYRLLECGLRFELRNPDATHLKNIYADLPRPGRAHRISRAIPST